MVITIMMVVMVIIVFVYTMFLLNLEHKKIKKQNITLTIIKNIAPPETTTEVDKDKVEIELEAYLDYVMKKFHLDRLEIGKWDKKWYIFYGWEKDSHGNGGSCSGFYNGKKWIDAEKEMFNSMGWVVDGKLHHN